MDVAGDYHPYMEQHVIKQRLDKFGNRIRTPTQATANKAPLPKKGEVSVLLRRRVADAALLPHV